MNYVVPVSVLAPLITGIIRFGALIKAFRLLCYYFATSLCVNITTAILSYYRIPNLIFFHFYTGVEAIFLSLFFQLIIDNVIIKKILSVFIVAFPLCCIFNYIYLQNGNVFNTYTHSVEALLFMSLSIFYFWEQSKQEVQVKWVSIPLNWIMSGFLLYFSSTFFLYVFSNVLMNTYSKAVNHFIWNVHGVIIITTNLLWTIGFYKCKM